MLLIECRGGEPLCDPLGISPIRFAGTGFFEARQRSATQISIGDQAAPRFLAHIEHSMLTQLEAGDPAILPFFFSNDNCLGSEAFDLDLQLCNLRHLASP